MVFAFPQRALVIAFSVCLAGTTAAHSAPKKGDGWGTPAADVRLAAKSAKVNVGTVNPALEFKNASFGSGAVGLRNRGGGGIEVSGATGKIKKALIYWAVITQGPPTAAARSIKVKRGESAADFVNIKGTAVGSGLSPCWGGDTTTVFRGNIPLSIADSNGLYIVRLNSGANSSTNNLSPWGAVYGPPLFEGASIILIGTGTSDIAVYDKDLAGTMFFSQLKYKLKAPVSVAKADEVLFHSIGADGQIGVDVSAAKDTSRETTELNGRLISGPGSPANDGDWNGASAGPLPQLWDNVTHEVTKAAKAGSSPTLLSFSVKAPFDCLVAVANLVSIRNDP